jgi:hypothetical protein
MSTLTVPLGSVNAEDEPQLARAAEATATPTIQVIRRRNTPSEMTDGASMAPPFDRTHHPQALTSRATCPVQVKSDLADSDHALERAVVNRGPDRSERHYICLRFIEMIGEVEDLRTHSEF